MTDYNASHRPDVRAATKAAKIETMQRGNVIREIMSSPTGRAWMLHQLESANVFHTTFTPDPYMTAFNEGVRSHGLALIADIMAFCPSQYVLMMNERNERDASRSAAAERARSESPNGGAIDPGFDYGPDNYGDEVTH